MIRPQHLLSGLSVLAVTAALGLLPVVTPAWAQPHPVAPSVKTWPLAGLDRASLAATPPAFDPATAAGVDPDTHRGKRAVATTVPVVFTAAVDTGRFTAAGVSWSPTHAPTGVVVQVRLREAGAWGEWHALDQEGGPDANTTEARNAPSRVATSPLVSPDATAVQVRVDSATGTPPADLRLLTVDPGTSSADTSSFGAPAASASAATTQPGIYTRAQWGADEGLVGSCPGYSPTVKVGFVHHTVSSNSYTADQVPGLIRGIYAYHVQGNGWCDVGYNFLVDKFGRIFEGRHGGISRTPVGSHTLAFNDNSFGVAAIGDHSATAPGSAMLGAITSVMGWKLGLHKRSATGVNQLVSAGGAGAKWPAGTTVTFPTVSGHRDAYSTQCPGNALYGQLQTIRTNAARYATGQTTRDENLYGALAASSGRVEIHSQSASSQYRQRMNDIATSWASGHPEEWTFAVGSTMADSRPDLIGVHRRGTTSGRVEVRVASWASGYTSTTVDAVTPMPALSDEWQVAVGGPTGGGVYLVRLRGGSSRAVEVHVLDSDSDYTRWSQHTATGLPPLAASSRPTVLVAKDSGDLFAVLHGSTGSRRTEVHVATAASRYRSFSAHAVTPVGTTEDTRAQWLLGTAATPDVYLVPTAGTGSGQVEVHRISAASRWSAFSLHVATNLPPYGGLRWQFSMG
ncbi:MAG: peptidoglycan recognition protein [Actinomycetota bacterium]|nr:peptidoglycan recognition protein [Actinomycetota bacterium]